MSLLSIIFVPGGYVGASKIRTGHSRERIDKYFGNAWGVFRGKDSYDVEIEFTKEAANLVTETRWHKTQEVTRHPDGGASLSFRVDGLDEILWWVLGWSGRAKVIKPENLRKMVIEKLQHALEMYLKKGLSIRI